MESNRTLRVKVVAAAAIALSALLVVVAAVGGDDAPTAAQSQPTEASPSPRTLQALDRAEEIRERAKEQTERYEDRHGSSGGPGHEMTGTFPARIGPNPDPFFSGEILKIVNGWATSNHRRFTAVQVGANPYDKSVGVIGVYRHNYVQISQDGNVVYVEGAGALKIVDAPEGRGAVQTWAQKRGNLRFTSKSGQTGVFHLKNDTVTLDP